MVTVPGRALGIDCDWQRLLVLKQALRMLVGLNVARRPKVIPRPLFLKNGPRALPHYRTGGNLAWTLLDMRRIPLISRIVLLRQHRLVCS